MRNISVIVGFLLFSQSVLASIAPLTQEYQNSLIKNHLWYAECPVPLSRLREVTVNYYDFDDHLHTDGKLIVLDAVAPQTEKIFKELERRHFPFKKIRPTSDYQGDDEASMEDDNTSAFNCRPVTGKTDQFSLHAYGVAIDINPLENPYIGFDESVPGNAMILPKNATYYVNRIFHAPGSSESVVDVFARYGFTGWGGNWHTPIDYQHFQVPREVAEKLVEDHIKFGDWKSSTG